jgi:hypothetical protein
MNQVGTYGMTSEKAAKNAANNLIQAFKALWLKDGETKGDAAH